MRRFVELFGCWTLGYEVNGIVLVGWFLEGELLLFLRLTPLRSDRSQVRAGPTFTGRRCRQVTCGAYDAVSDFSL